MIGVCVNGACECRGGKIGDRNSNKLVAATNSARRDQINQSLTHHGCSYTLTHRFLSHRRDRLALQSWHHFIHFFRLCSLANCSLETTSLCHARCAALRRDSLFLAHGQERCEESLASRGLSSPKRACPVLEDVERHPPNHSRHHLRHGRNLDGAQSRF